MTFRQGQLLGQIVGRRRKGAVKVVCHALIEPEKASGNLAGRMRHPIEIRQVDVACGKARK